MISPQSPLGRLLVGMASQIAWHRTGRLTPSPDDFALASVVWDYLVGEGVTMQSLSVLALGLGEQQSHWYLAGVLITEKCVFGSVTDKVAANLNELCLELPDVDATMFAPTK